MSKEMTDTVTNKKYERIEWTDIRDGDVLFHENGDRLTVNGRERTTVYEHDYVIVLEQPWSTCRLADAGFTPYRKQPEMPNEPGAYLDRDGNAWLRAEDWDGKPWSGQSYSDWQTPEEAAKHAPFTRLVPVPTEEQIVEVLDSALDTPRELAATVMALLKGE